MVGRRKEQPHGSWRQSAYNDDLVHCVLSGKASTPRPDSVIESQNTEP
jgi:hypothetical protein